MDEDGECKIEAIEEHNKEMRGILSEALTSMQEVIDKLQNAVIIVEEGGSHLFEETERHFDGICKFI